MARPTLWPQLPQAHLPTWEGCQAYKGLQPQPPTCSGPSPAPAARWPVPRPAHHPQVSSFSGHHLPTRYFPPCSCSQGLCACLSLCQGTSPWASPSLPRSDRKPLDGARCNQRQHRNSHPPFHNTLGCCWSKEHGHRVERGTGQGGPRIPRRAPFSRQLTEWPMGHKGPGGLERSALCLREGANLLEIRILLLGSSL